MTPLIEARALSKRYGDRLALSDVSFTVDRGECVGLLGPNGAGKSTLLTIVEGLRTPTSGSVRLFGGDPRAGRSRIALGCTPQATALPEALRVGEVLDYVAAHFPAPAPRARIVDEFGLGALLKTQCGALSGGQQRRVAVALAFIGDPELVLLDEPTTGLDVDGRRSLWDAVRARQESGCTIVVTSHHLEEIEQLARRVVVLDEGTIRADDTIDAIVRTVTRRRVQLRGIDPARILALDPRATVTAEGDTVTAVVEDSDAFIRSLVLAGHPFRDMSVRGATLEEAFLTLTAKAA